MTDRRPMEEQAARRNGRPAGTTDWRGSITERGTTMDSYYGRPIVKEPVWQPEIPVYFFTGGIAGASAVLHGVARVTGNERLAKSALYVGAAADAVSPLLLISDLGRPERFLHMLRMFKVTSPMSVGSWILVASSGASTTAAALELLGRLKPVKLAAELVSFLSGPPLATYTGALIANTAIPVWSEARDELPWLFGASAAASAGAAAAITTPVEHAGPARRAALAGVALELGLMQAMEKRLGFVGEVYKQGTAGRLNKLTKVCTLAGGALLAARGKQSRVAAVAGSSLVLAGELALRWSVFRAGFQSARDPRYTVIPQKERLATRKGGQSWQPKRAGS
jgi:formate-dependent nitrite reductase membrane component NrfD